MFEKFCDYMYYLLTSPFKRVKKALNQWYILFKVLGKRFDDAMESLYDAREQTMLATCDPDMLPVHAADRKMAQYPGEDDENFRLRIVNHTEVLKFGGSDRGVILAVRSLGYDRVMTAAAKKLKNDDSRWAEFFVIIYLEADEIIPIDHSILRKQVRKTKEVGALDNYLFIIQSVDIKEELCDTGRYVVKSEVPADNLLTDRVVLILEECHTVDSDLVVEIKNDLWHWDGQYQLDGIKKFDAYEKREELR